MSYDTYDRQGTWKEALSLVTATQPHSHTHAWSKGYQNKGKFK